MKNIRHKKQLSKILACLTAAAFCLTAGGVYAQTGGGAPEQKQSEGSGGKSSGSPWYSIFHHKKEGKDAAAKDEGSGQGGKGYSGDAHMSGSGAHVSGAGAHGKEHGGGHHAMMDPFKHVMQFKSELGLTGEQMKKLGDLQFEYEKTRIDNDARHEIAHMDMMRQLHAESLDESKVRRLADDIGAVKTEMIKAAAEAKIGVMKTLTPEQKKKMRQMYETHQGAHQGK